ncbi:hypothetical protein BDN71DRAFT_1441616 [Pleurotus eryngii]|uniref:Uncharacterized protein n=1 Tax=Pleurotus eryngii TaxID=5323 RepID=A0A9P6DAQ0_PLEER|nr:hypothetical protein BDN71DRAFT_1441616 [Pleurotus eryngii]
MAWFPPPSLTTNATLFGCIHCMAWNFELLTRIQVERLLWISSSLVVAATPCIPTAGAIISVLVSPILDRFLYRVRFVAFTKGGDFIHNMSLVCILSGAYHFDHLTLRPASRFISFCH